MPKRYVIALGGNAILSKGDSGTFEDQYKNVAHTMNGLTNLFEDNNNEIVITHGNGPQVGNIMIQNAAGKKEVPEMPMFVCGAMSQGQIGLLLQQSLTNLFRYKNIDRKVATIVTQVEVSADDPGFTNPSKPVGPFYSEEEAKKIEESTGHKFKEDAGRGYRRVVASPKPVSILEEESIEASIKNGTITVGVGGGGIPVIKKDGEYLGTDAVIDKDRASALLANNLDADVFIILTAVDQVLLNFGKPDEKPLAKISVDEAEKYMSEGHFAEGSMKPKIEAVVEFVKGGKNRKALITSSDVLSEALEGNNGTWIG